MPELLMWLVVLAALPGVVVIAQWSGIEVERLRRLAVVCSVLLVPIASMAIFVPALADAEIVWPETVWLGVSGRLWGPSVVRSDTLASVLIPMVAALWLVTLAVTPRRRLDSVGIRRTAVATLITILVFSTVSPVLLALLWVGSAIPYLLALSAPGYRRAQRVATIYLGASTALFVLGVILCVSPGMESENEGSALEAVGLIALIVAALIRKGIFPFHAWMPEVFEHGPLGPAVMLCAPQIGSYVTVVLIVPSASADALRVVAILALITAVYGAALALIQSDARRSLGYLFVSQSALVMAGLDATSELALAGSMVLWVSSALAFAGIARCVLVLEVRRGRLDISRFHGGYEHTPMLAVSFLILGLACTGFPGTLGFIGEELLVAGATEAFPVLGFFVVIAGALTGLAVLRMYFSLFCGSSSGHGPALGARRSELIVFGGLAAVLIAAGISPKPLVRSRITAAAEVLEQRALQASIEHVSAEP